MGQNPKSSKIHQIFVIFGRIFRKCAKCSGCAHFESGFLGTRIHDSGQLAPYGSGFIGSCATVRMSARNPDQRFGPVFAPETPHFKEGCRPKQSRFSTVFRHFRGLSFYGKVSFNFLFFFRSNRDPIGMFGRGGVFG